MPKINSDGIPSYEGHAGIVENAHGVLFNVDSGATSAAVDEAAKNNEERTVQATPESDPVRFTGDAGTAETERLNRNRDEVAERAVEAEAEAEDGEKSEQDKQRKEAEKVDDSNPAKPSAFPSRRKR